MRDYKVAWDNPWLVVEDLLCECEVGNPHDTHIMAVSNDGNLTAVGHIPQRIY